MISGGAVAALILRKNSKAEWIVLRQSCCMVRDGSGSIGNGWHPVPALNIARIMCLAQAGFFANRSTVRPRIEIKPLFLLYPDIHWVPAGRAGGPSSSPLRTCTTAPWRKTSAVFQPAIKERILCRLYPRVRGFNTSTALKHSLIP